MKYQRMTPTDSIVLMNEFTQPLSENKSIQYAVRLQALENKIESGELITKEEHLKRCQELYEQGKFDAMAEIEFSEELKDLEENKGE